MGVNDVMELDGWVLMCTCLKVLSECDKSVMRLRVHCVELQGQH